MIAGCALHLLAFVVVTLLVDVITAPVVPPVLRPWTAAVIGVLVTLGLSNVWSVLRGHGRGDRSRAALQQRALRGEVPSEDGPFLATGEVQVDGLPLTAPLSGRPCAAYFYRLYRRTWSRGRGWNTEVMYWGYACLPFRLDGPARSLRVLAMPRIDDEPTRFDGDAASIARVVQHLSQAVPEPGGVAGLRTVAAAVTMAREVVSEQTRGVRRDWLPAPPTADDLAGLLLEESLLPVQVTASAWGLWDAGRQALIPGALTSGTPGVTVRTGPPEQLLQHSDAAPSSALAVTVMATVLLALAGVLTWAARAGHVTALADRLGGF